MGSWLGVPMATDIAFTLGLMALLGSKVWGIKAYLCIGEFDDLGVIL
jgi:Na+/H+ antiporter NhaA